MDHGLIPAYGRNQKPARHKLRATDSCFRSPYTRAQRITLLPLMNPTTRLTEDWGGIEGRM